MLSRRLCDVIGGREVPVIGGNVPLVGGREAPVMGGNVPPVLGGVPG